MRHRGKEPKVTMRKKLNRKRHTIKLTKPSEHLTEKEIESVLGLDHRDTIDSLKKREK